MRAFRWLLGFGFLSAALALEFSAVDRALLLLCAGLTAWGADIANKAQLVREDWRRGRKERRERQRHTEVRGDIAETRADLATMHVKVDQILASVTHDAEIALAREDTDEAKAVRRSEYERISEAFHEIIALYDNAMGYGTLATDALRDIGQIITGDTAETNEMEVLLGLPIAGDPEYHKRVGAQSKVEQIWQRIHLYHRERVERIGNDKLLMPSEPPLLPSTQIGTPIPLDTPLGEIGANDQ